MFIFTAFQTCGNIAVGVISKHARFSITVIHPSLPFVYSKRYFVWHFLVCKTP